MLDLTVIILTYNEEVHIRRCLDNVSPIAEKIFIIDCYSTDKTLGIAKEYNNVEIFQHKWENNYAKQFNWGLENAPIHTKWVLRLDADEYLTPELIQELEQKIPSVPDEVTGFLLPLRRVFLGKTLRRGLPPVILLRIFQYGKGKSELRLMDEHIQLTEGITYQTTYEFADDNLNDLSWWTQKHIGYAIREAVDLLDIELDLTGAGTMDTNKQIGVQALAKRMKKHKYAKLPLFWRSFAYFCNRYFLHLGFLEGKEGFLWHFLQGWWYRTLVDAKIFEIKKACGNDKEKIRGYLREKYNITL